MYQTTNLPNTRIEVADALRGLAVVGIILVHSCEHFNLFWSGYSFDRALVAGMEEPVQKVAWWLFAGKMYTIFAMLFGLSFYIQSDNQAQRGRPFAGRFMWRMLLLLGIGMVNTALYNGDVLVLYALLGMLVPWIAKLPTRWLWVLAGVLLLQPSELLQAATGHSFSIAADAWGNAATPAYTEGSLLDTLVANLRYGQLTCLSWYWNYGRVTQTLGMFILGMLLGRARLFYNEGQSGRIWLGILFSSLLVAGVLFKGSGGFETPIQIVLSSWYNLAQTLFMVSGVVLLWYAFTGFRRAFGSLSVIGRMSLTNYMLQSLLGSFVFYNWGLGMFRHVGMAYGLLLGVGIVLVQYTFCRLWLKYHNHGPVEALWKRLTWIGSK